MLYISVYVEQEMKMKKNRMHHTDNAKLILAIIMLTLVFFSCGGSGGSGSGGDSIIHIDPSVSVSGDGSLTRPYKYWSEVTFQAGYTYAQKRGTIAREEVIIDVSGTDGNTIILGAYGTGDAPVIRGSELETGWTHVNGNIYSKEFDSNCRLGMAAEDGSVLKFIPWDTNYGTTFTGAAAGSFSVDYNTNTLYIWCTAGVPSDHQMEVSRRYRGIIAEGVSYITIQDLKVMYVSLVGIDIGACGILSSGCGTGASCSNVTVKNCTVTGCGGIWFGDPYNYHLGNGIQFANGAVDCRVENCIITDIFDSGFTPQVYTDGQSQSGIVIINTTIERCGFAGVEIAGLNNMGTTGSISNVTVERVTVSGSGKGWSGDRSEEYKDEDDNPEIQAIGIKICADDGSGLSNIRIEQSSVTDCKGHAIWIYGDAGTVTVNRSKIFGNDGNAISALDDRTDLTLQLVVTSSLIYNNGGCGIDFDVQYGQGYRLYNNTFYNNGDIQLFVKNNSNNALVKNNIFCAPDNAQQAHVVCLNPSAGIAYNYNCYYGSCTVGLIGYGPSSSPVSYSSLPDFRVGTGHEANGLDLDPEFTDMVNGDFTLQAESQCIGQGDPGAGVALDYSGNAFKNPPSIGAIENYYIL